VTLHEFDKEEGTAKEVGTIRDPVVRVRKVEGDNIRVRSRSAEGWIDKDDVVPVEEAISYFGDRISVDKDDAWAFNMRGCAYYEKADLDKALADYNEAIRLRPRESAYLVNRGILWLAKAETDKGIDDFNKAIELDPQDSAAFGNRGVAQTIKKEYQKAVADYDTAVKLEPRDANALNNRAWLRATCPDGKFRDGKLAVESAREAYELFAGSDATNLDTLAAAHAENGDFDEAVTWQKKALAAPDFPKSQVENATKRLKLYEAHKPYRAG
jgi:tetratricopeptide (TPR) repeat protein